MDMEEVGCFETSVLVYQTTRRYVPVDCNVCCCCCCCYCCYLYYSYYFLGHLTLLACCGTAECNFYQKM